MNLITRQCIAEFTGTLFLIIAAIGSVILAHDVFKSGIAMTVFTNAVSVGFILFTLIEMFAPVSSSHFNPAVTIAMLLTKKITSKNAFLYIMAQFTGGFAGLLFTHLMFYDTNPALIYVSEQVTGWPKFISEFLCTFLLAGAVILLVKSYSNHISLAIGLLVGGMILTTSSNMYANPAVSFARVFTYAICGISPFTAITYMAAEVSGAVFAVFVFKDLLSDIPVKSS